MPEIFPTWNQMEHKNTVSGGYIASIENFENRQDMQGPKYK